MQCKVERHYDITFNEVKEAVLLWLESRDVPRPSDPVLATFEASSSGGLMLSWTDEIDR